MTIRMTATVLFLSVLLLSCSKGDRQGSLAVSGSSTLAPMAEILLEDFIAEGYPGQVSLDTIGTRAGFSRFLEGSCDVVTASRPMTEEERRLAEAEGMQPAGFILAMDAVAICTGGGIVADLSLNDLRRLLVAESWIDVNHRWPDRPVNKYYPGLDSGTFAYIVSVLYNGDSHPLLSSPYLQFSEDDHVLVQGLMGDRFAVGFFGYSYYLQNRNRLGILSISGRLPADGDEYPLARPLYLYFDSANLKENPDPARFIALALETVASGGLPTGFLSPSGRTMETEAERLSLLTGTL